MRNEVFMKRDLIRSLHSDMQAYADREVILGGWVRSVRTGKDFGFIDLNDGSCHKGVQVVFEQQFVENFAEVGKLNVGAAIVVRGILVLTPDNQQPLRSRRVLLR